MIIHLVSSKGRARHFSALKRGGEHRLVKVAPGKLESALEEAPEDSFFYVDANALPEERLLDLVGRISRDRPGCVGVFDSDGSVSDPAQIFFRGGVDYLPRQLFEAGVTAERFSLVRRLATGSGPARPESAEAHFDDFLRPPREIPSGEDWSEVNPGVEYTFWLLFASLDDTQRYTAHTSDAYASRLDQRFQEQLMAEMDRFGGHVWMWKRFEGLLLFPYDGERCMPIVPAFRMFMNRIIATVEHYQLKQPVSYRMALHLGNTTYQESGSTGDVVSDDVNFIFHLGNKYTDPGHLSVTDTALSFVPAGLQRHFVEKGSFEGRRIYVMRPILPGI